MKPVFLLLTCFLGVISTASAANTILQVQTQQLKNVYMHRFGHAPDLNDYRDLALAINTSIENPQLWCGGIWDGFTTTDKSGAECYEVILCDAHKGKKLEPNFLAVQTLFSNRFGHQPNFNDLRDRALTISTFVTKKEPTYAGAFWNGEHGNDPHGVDLIGLVGVEPGSHPVDVPVRELKDAFKHSENREPVLEHYAELSRSIVYWAKAHGIKAWGGFWNGEVVESTQGPIYGVVLIDNAP